MAGRGVGSTHSRKVRKTNGQEGLGSPAFALELRRRMVEDIRCVYHLNDKKVLGAMLQVPREKFIPRSYWSIAYSDSAVPIGFGQTISQPYTVAFMSHLLNLSKKKTVLEIGTGSGYQAAVLSHLARWVYTVEIVPQLALRAEKLFKKLGYSNVEVKVGSGEEGWEEKSPFDAIIITANIQGMIPDSLFNQLKVAGVVVSPIRGVMTRFKKAKGGEIVKEEFGKFSFVPFVSDKITAG